MALTQIVKDGLGANLTATSEGGAVTTSVQQGLAKAWVDFNMQGTAQVDDSLGIASLTDSGTGEGTLSISNSFSNANYCPVSAVGGTATSDQAVNVLTFHDSTAARTTSSIRTSTSYANDTNIRTQFDSAYNNVVFHGDLA